MPQLFNVVPNRTPNVGLTGRGDYFMSEPPAVAGGQINLRNTLSALLSNDLLGACLGRFVFLADPF